MSDGLAAPSPKRSGRSRFSELLRPSPPVSNPVQLRKPPLTNGSTNGTETKAGDVSAWPLVPSTDFIPDTRSTLASKSMESGIEVVVGTRPIKPQAVTVPQRDQMNGTPQASRRFSKVMATKPNFAWPMASANRLGSEEPLKPHHDDASSPGLQRSASDLNLPDVRMRADTSASQQSRPSIRSAVSEIGLANYNNSNELAMPQAAAIVTKETKVSRRQSITNRLRSRSRPQPMTFKKSGSGPDLTELPKAILSPKEQVANPVDSMQAGGRAKRTSWIIGSRSPSPSNRKLLQPKKSVDGRPGQAVRSKSQADASSILSSRSDTIIQQPEISRTSTNSSGNKKSKRPLSAILTRSSSFAGGSKPTIHLPKSISVERLPAMHSPIDEVPEMPKNIPKHRLQTPNSETPKKKDELYSVFRGLDAEHQKFISKPSSLRVQVVRAGLLPFLKNYADHASTRSLRAEDLDRRVNILNKWWMSLLEMLNGRNGHTVSPNDRPAVLEAVSGIMTRPEWRLSLSTISSRNPSKLPVSRSVSSLESASSDFLAESVLHNVRNIFVQNLLSQMAFVVERMSTRTVPASLVTFCGKACAYAFFFCPGVAEILVRLWSPSPDAVKRALKEAGAMAPDYDPSFASDVLGQNFPSHLKPLTCTSCIALQRYLRGKPKDNISANSAYIPWNGPWVGRWCGRDSDLFFVFVKTAIALICELVPETTSPADWVTVPCAALIQAQIISVMDATLHRGSTQSDPLEGLPPPTFDDVLGVDAVVQPLPPRAPNTIRIMAENRLIVLLRECLFSPSFVVKPYARRIFAQMYASLLKAATRRVSLFDHNAVFTLCDFLDEAFSMLTRFHKDDEEPQAWMDWTFWFDVLKKMGETQNTMSEVRLYTFVYGLWGILTPTESRLKDVCQGWLLRGDYFDRQFNHWCPMVRAYYMRLLCWRVAREDGESNETRVLIYRDLFDRLNVPWSWFLALQALAKESGTSPLSTAPASPAPGRKMVIIRNDSGAVSGGPMNWDSMMAAASSSAQPNTYQRYTSLNLVQTPVSPGQPEAARTPSPKKSWLRKMNPFTSSTQSSPGTRSSTDSDTEPAPSKHEDSHIKQPAGKENKRASIMPAVSQSGDLRGGTAPGPSPRTAAAASFKFSLEWADKATLVARERRLHAPQLPQLAQQLVDAELTNLNIGDEKVQPRKPRGPQVGPSKYAGRALAEWELLVRECQSFYDRRRAEGVTDVKWVETPTLGVESFRRPAG